MLLCSLAPVVQCASGTPRTASEASEKAEPSARTKSGGPVLLRPILALIKRHREHGTHIDGPRCPLYPSCAGYGEKAIRRHSLLGFFLTIDRLLIREVGGLEAKFLFTPRHKSKHLRYYDPIDDSIHGRRPSLLQEEYRPVGEDY